MTRHDALERLLLAADRAIRAGSPPRDVLAWFRQKGLKVGFDWRDVWKEEHDAAFTIAKVLRADVLQAMQEELAAALEEGKPYEQFARDIKPRMQRLGWWGEHQVQDPKTQKIATVKPPQRLKTIYATNMRISHAIGQWDRIERNRRTRPYLLYQTGASQRHREQHLAWHGLLLPVDDPFWTFAMPPNGFGCACYVRSVSPREHKQLVRDGIMEAEPKPILDDEGNPTGAHEGKRIPVRTEAPRVPLVPWLNKRTGKVEMVREGIGPGFDRLPGESRAATLQEGRARVQAAKKPRR